MNIRGKAVTLRAAETRDIELLNKWANDPDIWRLLGGWHFPYSSLCTERWVSDQNNNNLKAHVFCIDAPEVGLIGTANLIDIDWKNRHAYHGMMLGDKDVRGKGYGLDTVMAVMRYAFDELGLVRLDGGMVELNERSIQFYTRTCGWEIEGRKKNWFYREGRFFDQIIVGITRDGYRALVERTGYWNT
ncbi:GNAT family N-acetyltransferase [Noviherbaspirillum sp. ST9]|uniref:GNAT family N-acetyltransferase n=1 Tax=Noviherbaspirillum sp. ST9 TaxID=3401606 RepID=UPI003B587FF7